MGSSVKGLIFCLWRYTNAVVIHFVASLVIVLQAKITGHEGSAHKGLLQNGHESTMAYALQLFFIDSDILWATY